MLDEAKKMYQQALAEGGLDPKEVVLAYSRIGTVKAALRDKKGALSAFRVAAAIDPAFELPADSGKVAKKLYAQARKEADSQGEKLSIKLKAPKTSAARTPFKVETEIPEGFAVFVTKVVVTVEDTLTGKRYKRTMDSDAKLSFGFPGRVTTPGARLKIVARGVDGQNNAWVMATAKLKVAGQSEELSPFDEDEPKPDAKKDKKRKKGGFFKGPLPWIIGGAVVLVGGIVAFAATRPSDEVGVAAPTWQQ